MINYLLWPITVVGHSDKWHDRHLQKYYYFSGILLETWQITQETIKENYNRNEILILPLWSWLMSMLLFLLVVLLSVLLMNIWSITFRPHLSLRCLHLFFLFTPTAFVLYHFLLVNQKKFATTRHLLNATQDFIQSHLIIKCYKNVYKKLMKIMASKTWARKGYGMKFEQSIYSFLSL